MKIRLFKICLLLFTIFFSRNLKSQEIWSLQECIEYAHNNNIQLKQQELNTKINSNNYLQSKLNILPQINASTSHNFSFGRALDESTYEFTDDQTVQSTNFSLNASADLFKGFQNKNTIQQKHLDLLASVQDEEKMKNDLSLNITSAYLQILFNKELAKNAKNQLEITKQQVKRTEQLVNAGSLAKGSLLDINAQQASEELQLIQAENQLNLSYLSLAQILDLDSIANFRIEKPELKMLPNQELKSSKEIFDIAKNDMPQIKSAEFTLKSNAKALQIARGMRYPTLSVYLSFGSRYSDIRQRMIGSQFTMLPFGETESGEQVFAEQKIPIYSDYAFNDQLIDNQNTVLGFSLSIPIFNKWQINNSVSNAKISVLNAKYSVKTQENQVLKDVQHAYADAIAASKKYYASVKSVESLEESFRYTQQKFNIGMINSTDYNNSKNQLTNAKSELLQAKYEFIFKKNILNFYQGKKIEL
ncbi:MAG: TolC family protein [Bacteroidota bacterium]|nr:TolC family protein [Bacteroidota bacterium]